MNTQPSLHGQLTFDGDWATLFFQRRLAHPPGRVWAALTDPSELRRWFMASAATVDGQVGGTMDTVAGPAQIRAHGKILTWDPPHVYEYEWKTEARPEIPHGEDSVVRWELQPIGSGTLLTLRQRRLTPGTATGFGPGWHAFLDRLEAQVAGQPLPDWQERFMAVAPTYPGWAKAAAPH